MNLKRFDFPVILLACGYGRIVGKQTKQSESKGDRMKAYSEFRPTAFDCRGVGLQDQQHWLVAPCGVNRDSDALTRSNFKSCLKALGGESESVQVHRFGHWGPGWFELILIDPTNSEAIKIGEEIESALEDYPVLDEMDFSEEENN